MFVTVCSKSSGNILCEMIVHWNRFISSFSLSLCYFSSFLHLFLFDLALHFSSSTALVTPKNIHKSEHEMEHTMSKVFFSRKKSHGKTWEISLNCLKQCEKPIELNTDKQKTLQKVGANDDDKWIWKNALALTVLENPKKQWNEEIHVCNVFASWWSLYTQQQQKQCSLSRSLHLHISHFN